jgi:anti-sigma factor RsiW
MKWTCEIVEERLSDHLDGTLSAAETREFSAHVAGCARCSALVAQVSGILASVHRLDSVETPLGLEARIVDSMLGPERKRERPWPAWIAWVRPVVQPRFAMGFATVIFGAYITLLAAGVNISPKDFTWFNMKRQAHLTYARGVKFVNDIRVVYEIRTRLQGIRENDQEQESNKEKPAPQNEGDKRKKESNQLNTRPCPSCLIGTVLLPLDGTLGSPPITRSSR